VKKFRIEKIKIENLHLWVENARFPDKYFNSNESELIKYLVSNSAFKIKSFITEIVKDFDLPQNEKLIVLDDNGKYIVIEGNRRLAIYKLLINPELIDNKRLTELLIEKRKEISITAKFELECIVSDDIEFCFKYIERKHTKGNNEVNWKENERAHFLKRKGDAKESILLRTGIGELVKELDVPEKMQDEIIGEGYVTNFYRIILSSPAKKIFGYKIDENGDLIITDKEFNEKLKVVIINILNKKDFRGNKIDSRSLNTNIQIEDYLNSIKKEDYKKADNEIDKKYRTSLFGQSSSTNSGNQQTFTGSVNKPNPTTTVTGITPTTPSAGNGKSNPKPKGLFHSNDVPFKIRNANLRIMYDELKNLEVALFPNAAHDLLRSFLECSLIVFFKNKNEFDNIQKNSNHNPTLGEMLTFIINGKSNSITDQNVILTIKQIKTDYDKPYSLERLNMINHNEHWVSNEREVRSTWGKLESLFKLILG
jgi:hypothetical protein